jgi:hypothetical protein
MRPRASGGSTGILGIAAVYSRFGTANLITQERSVAAVAKGSRLAGCRRFPKFGARTGAVGHLETFDDWGCLLRTGPSEHLAWRASRLIRWLFAGNAEPSAGLSAAGIRPAAPD